jgi:hypothetical protein
MATVPLTLNSRSWDRARWTAATTTAARLQIPASSVDGGFEWVGYHSQSSVDVRAFDTGGRRWWTKVVTDFHGCVFVSSGPQGGQEPVIAVSYKEVGFAGDELLYAYRIPGCGG